MAPYDKQTLSRIARELGFARDTLEKVYRLVEILRLIQGDPLLSTSLALKGGTAINLTIFSLPRLSVDIDLDFVHNIGRDEMMNARKEITLIIMRYMVAEGYEESGKSKNSHSLDSFVFMYTTSSGSRDNIKIEINYSLRAHFLKPTIRSIVKTGVFSSTSVLSLAPIEIFAGKINALISRTAARDLFDVDNMVTRELYHEKELILLRKCVVFYYVLGDNWLEFPVNIDRISGLTAYRIRTDLRPVIKDTVNFDLITTQTRVKNFLVKLVDFNNDEQAFIKEFQQGNYLPELLANGDSLENIRNHPMIQWKLQQHFQKNTSL